MLQRLLENKLFVKAEKCLFHTESISFLGFQISPGQIKTVRLGKGQFLGFTNFYHCFVRNNSRIALPLTQLISSAKPFQWSSEAEKAFCTPKGHFSNALGSCYRVLLQPDPTKHFVVEVDASDKGVGAVLSQRAEDGKLRPCAFFSMWGTGSFLPSSSPWRSGATGWRRQSTPFSFGPTTGT